MTHRVGRDSLVHHDRERVSTQTAKALANELRDRIQALGYARHKLIVQVGRGMLLQVATSIPTSCWQHMPLKGRACTPGGLRLQVTVCQQMGQAMRAASRCLWDPANDGSAWHHFQNDTLTCICQVLLLFLNCYCNFVSH